MVPGSPSARQRAQGRARPPARQRAQGRARPPGAVLRKSGAPQPHRAQSRTRAERRAMTKISRTNVKPARGGRAGPSARGLACFDRWYQAPHRPGSGRRDAPTHRPGSGRRDAPAHRARQRAQGRARPPFRQAQGLGHAEGLGVLCAENLSQIAATASPTLERY